MPFSMHFHEGPRRNEVQSRRASWRGDALILTLCLLALLAADLAATGGQLTRAVIGGVGQLFERSGVLMASVRGR